VDVAGGDLENEEHVDALEGDCAVDMEEIACQQCLCLCAQKPPPGRVRAPARGWRDPQTFEYAADGRRGYSVTELEQLALNPAVSPAGVLACQSFDQRDDAVVDRRASCSVGIGPLLGHQAAVPAQDRAWCHQPMSAQQAGQPPHQRGEHCAIRPVHSWTWIRAAQHSDLVPQHQQLHVLGRRGPAEQDKPSTEPEEDQIHQS
jgi:hypothetical protein